MSRRRVSSLPGVALALLLLGAGRAHAQTITIPDVAADPGMILVKAQTDCPAVQWYAIDPGLQVVPSDLLANSKTAICFAMKAGKYRLQGIVAKGDKAAFAICTVTVGTPDPGPTPGPQPGPGPAPGPVTGLRVLIVEESAERTKLPVGQQNVILGKTVRGWLDAHCADWPEGKIKDWGIFDKDTDLSLYSKALRDMMARPRMSLPWIVISGDRGVAYEGPLPADVPSTIALLNKYAPAPKLRKAG